MTKLYVGNLHFTATGFVEMPNADASRAMQALNGTDFDGRALKVNEAQDRGGFGGGNRGPRSF